MIQSVATHPLLWLWAGALVARLAYPWWVSAWLGRGWVRANFAGHLIPFGSGWLLFGAFSACCLLQLMWMPPAWERELGWALFIGGLACCLIGWLDDLWGTDGDKGIRGHLRAFLREGRLTTGLSKAVGYSLLATAVVLFLASGQGIDAGPAFLGAMLLALGTNAVNLMDVRPGRALKFFFLLSFLILPFVQLHQALWVAPFAGAAAFLYFRDVRGECMLGDAGSNLLGYVWGVTALIAVPLWTQLLLVATLFSLHLYAEKQSLTATIERVPWLRRLDAWGRH